MGLADLTRAVMLSQGLATIYFFSNCESLFCFISETAQDCTHPTVLFDRLICWSCIWAKAGCTLESVASSTLGQDIWKVLYLAQGYS